MGIRFLCPNGHKLHVKAFLAGKRAICPECKAKVVVPSASGDVATTTEQVLPAEQTSQSEQSPLPEQTLPTEEQAEQPAAPVSTPPIAEQPAIEASAVQEPIQTDATPSASIAHRTKIKHRQKRRVQIALLLSTIVVVLVVALVIVVLQ